MQVLSTIGNGEKIQGLDLIAGELKIIMINFYFHILDGTRLNF